MPLLEIEHQAEWDRFQTDQPYAQFAQSWSWGEFREYLGAPVRRFALSDGKRWLAAVQLEYRAKKFGQGYWFANRGPIFAAGLHPEAKRQAMLDLCAGLLEVKALRRRTLFWRLMPCSELSQPEGLVPLSFRRAHVADPTSTIVLDLTQSEDELLKDMHEKTRYNVRLSQRHGVTARLASTEQDVEAFLDLMETTAARDDIKPHSRSYLRKTYEFLHARKMCVIRLAELNGKLLAAAMEIFYGDTYTYLHGASSDDLRNAMAPYAMQWSAIRHAKEHGFKQYDFFGVNPPYKSMYYYRPGWEGITRFKKGFGGRQIDLAGAWDLPFNIVLYRLAFFRQFWRG